MYAYGTLFTLSEHEYVVNRLNAILLNENDPYKIRSSPDIYLTASQRFRLVNEPNVPEGPYRVHTVEYFYQFADGDREYLTFHWTPYATDGNTKTFPHMHVGSGLFASLPTVFPEVFHKKHIPTGRVSFESIILFAIEELGVESIVPDYHAVLSQGQRTFDQVRRKP